MSASKCGRRESNRSGSNFGVHHGPLSSCFKPTGETVPLYQKIENQIGAHGCVCVAVVCTGPGIPILRSQSAHPLDPLSPTEIAVAIATVRAAGATPKVCSPSIFVVLQISQVELNLGIHYVSHALHIAMPLQESS